MSLQVWLPLDGDLRNQGCSNVTVTNNGATVDNNGKIGSCYYFNGNNYYIALIGQELFDCFKGGATAFSICMWAYHADTRRAILFGDYGLSNSIGFNIELSTGHGLRFYWNGSPDYSPGLNVGLNTWNHITLTYDGASLKSYLNGNLVATRDGVLTARSKTTGEFRLGRDTRTTDTALNGKLNDVRIYDHCLSAAEVKEISQGLVLHYKLDDLTNGVLDSSGYGHNGEIINTLSTSNDTSRYNACTHISATNQKIKISNFPTSGFGNSYSFSWWAKISSVDPMHWGFADGIRLNGMYTGRLWNTGDSSNNPLYTPGTTTQVTAPTVNVWHHWVMTGDGTTCKVYQDGVHWATAKTYKAISGQTIYINGWDNGTSYCSNNYSVSDFRIYCTALSAADILQLYHTSAKVDNKQNLHTFELVENNSAIKINKRGQTLCNELEENVATKFYKTNQIIETNESIEL